MTGFEPATFALARRRSSQLSYIRIVRERTAASQLHFALCATRGRARLRSASLRYAVATPGRLSTIRSEVHATNVAEGMQGLDSLSSGSLAENCVFCYNNTMRLQIAYRSLVAAGTALLGAGAAYAQTPPAQMDASVPLLQPLGGMTAIPIGSGYQTFLTYFNDAVGWIFQVAVGFTVVWVLIGGFMYMTSGNNQSQRGAAISRMTWAIGGLLILLFAGFILRTLNNIFYVV